MQTVIANTLNEGLTLLGVNRSSYFRWRTQGRASDVMVMVDGQPMVKVEIHDQRGKQTRCDGMTTGRGDAGLCMRPENKHDAKIESFFGHKKHLKGWIEWRDSGIGQKVWSASYRQQQIRLGNNYFKKFDVISCENLRAWMGEFAPKSHSVRVDRYSFVVSMAKYLYKELDGIVSQDEYARLKTMYPGKTPDYEPKQHIIYAEDVAAIFEKLPAYYAQKPYHGLLMHTLVTLLAESGMRVSELASLQMENLSFSDNPRRAYIQVKGKGSKVRKIPFSRKAQEAIQHYIDNKPAEAGMEILFRVYHYRTKEYTTMNADWVKHELKDLSDFVGIKFTAHSFRHYRITQWANNPRIPITSTQLWAGHTMLTVTQRYIHIRDDDALIAAFG